MPLIKLTFVSLFATAAFASQAWVPEEGTTPWIGAWWWMQKHDSFVALSKTRGTEIQAVFLGDSITDLWANEGATVWAQHYANRHAVNYGIAGDRTENVLWRVEHGEFDGISPKVVLLMIGEYVMKE